MKDWQIQRRNSRRLRLIARLLACTILIISPVAVAQENAPQLSGQEYEPEQKRRISERLQEIENEKVSLRVGETPKEGALAAGKSTYYVPVRSYSLTREPEPPRYVRQLDKTWLDDTETFKGVDWIDLGLEYRLRYEVRDNDFRRNKQTYDEPILQRTRFYAAVKSKFDPFRATVELQDSRRFNSQFAQDNRDFNYFDMIQGYGELYLKDALGTDELGNERPFSVKAGRMAFELSDRRLIARNAWRNTTNSFQGVRATLGQQKSDWQAELFALQPVIRFIESGDKADQAQWLYAAVGDWRKWSQVVSLQPYYYLLQQTGSKVEYGQNGSPAVLGAKKDREIHTLGLRGYGVVGNTGLDYDLNYAKQWGQDGVLNHDAYAYNLEAGYTAELPWKPRFSWSFGFASGDKYPTDGSSQRFERLFGFARPWSNNDYFQMENIVTNKLRFEFTPVDKFKVDFGFSTYNLASATDRWNNAGLRDPSGKSGDDVGSEFDIRFRYPVSKYLALNIGYAYFKAGDFTKSTSQKIDPDRKESSNFLYVETSVFAF